jgi:hypothetical protein
MDQKLILSAGGVSSAGGLSFFGVVLGCLPWFAGSKVCLSGYAGRNLFDFISGVQKTLYIRSQRFTT